MDCVSPFAEATASILQEVLDSPSAVGSSFTCTSPVDVMEVVIILGLTGDYEGRVLFELSEDTALRIVEAMNFGEPFQEMDSMARSTLSELGNLIAGRAATLLNDGGGHMSITPPTLLCGVGMRASDRTPVQVIPVETGHGPLRVNLAVRPKPACANGNGR